MQDKTTKQDKETLKTRQTISFDPHVLSAIKFMAKQEDLNLSAYVNRCFKNELAEIVLKFQKVAEQKERLIKIHNSLNKLGDETQEEEDDKGLKFLKAVAKHLDTE